MPGTFARDGPGRVHIDRLSLWQLHIDDIGTALRSQMHHDFGPIPRKKARHRVLVGKIELFKWRLCPRKSDTLHLEVGACRQNSHKRAAQQA